MKLSQLDGLMAFWKVAEHRGFTAAAADLEVSPSALSQAIRQLETRLGVRLLNRTTRSVSLTEAGHAYLARIGPALGQVIDAGEELHVLQGRPAGTLRLNAARISTALVLQPILAGFLQEHPYVQLELTNDEGFVDIVEKGFDAGIRFGESIHRDMVAVPIGGPVAVAVVASPEYLRRIPAPRHPDDLVRHNCVRFRFAATGAIYKWEFEVDGRPVDYEITGNLTISDTMFGLEAALEGVGLAYTFEQLARPYIRAKRLKRVLTSFSPTFPGFYLYFPSRHDQPSKLKALIEYVSRRTSCTEHNLAALKAALSMQRAH
ncbi:LysR substrate-binding domain-containing protein [Variovorax sp. LjRoot178]|uniref:LysR family transcriptional regulator n=1 Tax=Variovorax sp. LjRoot178 TaxID=3342277 RepID=UPI003F50FA8B